MDAQEAGDRALLEAAARAAGLALFVWGKKGAENYCIKLPDNAPGERWNPLTDDGDALRLAVKLRMQIDIIDTQVRCLAANGSTVCELDLAGPSYAATRRAIVRAAASMG